MKKMKKSITALLFICGLAAMITGCTANTGESGKEEDNMNKATATPTEGIEVTPTPEVVNDVAETINTTAYLFATFKNDNGPNGQQIWFSVSDDGNNWTDLNDRTCVLSVSDSTEGDRGVRDPFLLRSNDGNHFYLIATDLCIGSGSGTHSWDTAQNAATCSRCIRIWESDDLVNWSEPWLAEIGVEGSCFTWAPEAIWDEESQQYMVYWSAGGTKIPGVSASTLQNRTWYCMTSDFRTFTEPQLYTSSVNGNGMIDMSIISAGNNTYYRISSSTPDMLLEMSTTGLFGKWSVVSSIQNLGFPYGAAGNSTSGIVIVEGPEIFKYNSDDSVTAADGTKLDTWGILLDNYGGLGYIPICTTDLSSTVALGTEGSSWFETDYDFDSPKRHGTILPITDKEYKALLEKWGNTAAEPVTDTEDEAVEPVLVYDFETTEGTTVIDTGLGSTDAYNGTLYGSAAVTEDAERGNILVLDGKTGSYLEFPQGFFDGRDVMTISMDVMSQKSSGNFFTFTYGLDSTVYDFLRIRGNSVRNAITMNAWGGEYETAGSGAQTGEWQNICLVVNSREHKLYIDGQLVSTAKVGNTTTQLGTGAA